MTSIFVVILPVQEIKICRRIFNLDQQVSPTTRSAGYYEADESVTKKIPETRTQEGKI